VAAITSGAGYEGVDEYDPLGDDHLDLPKHAPVAKIFHEETQDAASRQSSVKIHVERWQTDNHGVSVESSAPALVALRLLNYPAWQVTVRKSRHTAKPDDLDQMLVPIEAGKSEIQVRFLHTPDQTGGHCSFDFKSADRRGLLAQGRSRKA